MTQTGAKQQTERPTQREQDLQSWKTLRRIPAANFILWFFAALICAGVAWYLAAWWIE